MEVFCLEKMMKAVKQRAEEGGEYYLSVLTFIPKGSRCYNTQIQNKEINCEWNEEKDQL